MVGADAAFEMFVAPMLEQIPPMPQVPGMKEGKPYLAHSISKVNVDGTDFLRFIVFSGLDPASLWRDADIDIHDFVPSIHQVRTEPPQRSDPAQMCPSVERVCVCDAAGCLPSIRFL